MQTVSPMIAEMLTNNLQHHYFCERAGLAPYLDAIFTAHQPVTDD